MNFPAALIAVKQFSSSYCRFLLLNCSKLLFLFSCRFCKVFFYFSHEKQPQILQFNFYHPRKTDTRKKTQMITILYKTNVSALIFLLCNCSATPCDSITEKQRNVKTAIWNRQQNLPIVISICCRTGDAMMFAMMSI